MKHIHKIWKVYAHWRSTFCAEPWPACGLFGTALIMAFVLGYEPLAGVAELAGFPVDQVDYSWRDYYSSTINGLARDSDAG